MYGNINGKPAAVKCWFTSTGAPTPLMFKVLVDDDVITVNNVEVLDSKSYKEFGSVIWEFSCRSVINGLMALFMLRFDSKTCCWMLFENPNC